MSRSAATAVLAAVLAAAAPAPAAAPPPGEGKLPPPAAPASAAAARAERPDVVEHLDYTWRLGGLLGQLARLLVPGHGEGTLTARRLPSGRLAVELQATSDGAEADEFLLYGCEIEPATGHTVKAWTASRFRGRSKRREEVIDDPEVVCIPSAIRRLRSDPPDEPQRLLLWSDGKIYPVRVEPARVVLRRIDGRVRVLDHLRVEGVAEPGRRRWRGDLELWLDRSPGAEPVELVLRRRPGRLHLTLDPDEAGIR